MVKILLALIMLILPVNYAYASDEVADIKNAALDCVSEEFVACASFFSIASSVLNKSGEKDLATKYDKLTRAAIDYALVAAEKSRTKEMALKVTLARIEMRMKGMAAEIDGNASNISILSNKYAYRCRAVMDNPEYVVDECAEKVTNKIKKQSDKADDK